MPGLWDLFLVVAMPAALCAAGWYFFLLGPGSKQTKFKPLVPAVSVSLGMLAVIWAMFAPVFFPPNDAALWLLIAIPVIFAISAAWEYRLLSPVVGIVVACAFFGGFVYLLLPETAKLIQRVPWILGATIGFYIFSWLFNNNLEKTPAAHRWIVLMVVSCTLPVALIVTTIIYGEPHGLTTSTKYDQVHGTIALFFAISATLSLKWKEETWSRAGSMVSLFALLSLFVIENDFFYAYMSNTSLGLLLLGLASVKLDFPNRFPGFLGLSLRAASAAIPCALAVVLNLIL